MNAVPLPEPAGSYRDELVAKIDRFGFTMILVGNGECSEPGCTHPPLPHPYTYTLGLVEHDHPSWSCSVVASTAPSG